jgi:uncharacterized protein
MHPVAEFLPVAGGYRLCLLHRPSHPRRGVVVYAHPFAEEMNKARRMAALMARALAAHGWTVVQIDLAGCGDSSGDFSEATLARWNDDLELALAHANEALSEPQPEIWFWSIRAGALLLPDLLASRPHANLLLWQPALSGQTVLTQFLRLRVAAASLAGGGRTDSRALRRQLETDGVLEVGGYPLSLRLANELDAARLELPRGFGGRVVWIETEGAQPGELSPQARAQCTSWLAAGHQVTALTAAGAPFWQTQETTEAPAFIDVSLAAMDAH